MKFYNTLRKINSSNTRIIAITVSALTLTSKNPLKIRVLILVTTIIIFLKIRIEAGRSWFSSIITILFAGGILIIFIILSSLQPNEKIEKLKFKIFIPLLIRLLILELKLNNITKNEYNNNLNLKSFFISIGTAIISNMIIFLYFLVFIKVAEKEKNCIRGVTCYIINKLVNC